jgi:hypothetical protein
MKGRREEKGGDEKGRVGEETEEEETERERRERRKNFGSPVLKTCRGSPSL